MNIIYLKNNDIYLKAREFIENRPLYAIDATKRPEILSN